MKTKTCSKCKEEKLLSEFNKHRTKKDGLQNYCKVCMKIYQLKNQEKIAVYKAQHYKDHSEEYAAYNRKRLYGLEQEEYERMIIAQDNKCNICKKEFFKTPTVDHDHDTSIIRGLLCQGCNVRLGWLENRREAILKHLGGHI